MAAREISVGQPLDVFVIESVDPARMKTMAAILQDPNPIHYDTAVTQALGLGDKPVNQGPINLTWLIESAVRFAGGPDRLVSVKIRFLGNVFGGERFRMAWAPSPPLTTMRAWPNSNSMPRPTGVRYSGGVAVVKISG